MRSVAKTRLTGTAMAGTGPAATGSPEPAGEPLGASEGPGVFESPGLLEAPGVLEDPGALEAPGACDPLAMGAGRRASGGRAAGCGSPEVATRPVLWMSESNWRWSATNRA